MELVILVNEKDEKIGLMEKLEAHQKGLLHRAFSIFLFNEKKELLLQQRALEKYHCGGLWTNTVCSHQRDGEETISACIRRLKEEMGITEAKDLLDKYTLTYKAHFSNGITEHECDHMVIGKFNGKIDINPEEVMAYEWKSYDDIKIDIKDNPDKYTPWFKLAIDKVYTFIDSI